MPNATSSTARSLRAFTSELQYELQPATSYLIVCASVATLTLGGGQRYGQVGGQQMLIGDFVQQLTYASEVMIDEIYLFSETFDVRAVSCGNRPTICL